MTPAIKNGNVIVCWSCREGTVAGLFCATCQAILPLDPVVDFFRLFGVEPGFEVDLLAVERHYLALQQQLHPDFFATRSPTERRYSLEHVTRINEARQTLVDPVLRAGYLLQLLGWQPDLSGSDPEFLLTVMELREAMEEISPKSGDAMVRLHALRVDISSRKQVEERSVAELFREFKTRSNQELLSRIACRVDRLRYYRRCLEEVDRLEDQTF